MELAKVTSKGQITIPISIRQKLGLRDGDKVLFIDNGNSVVMMNSSMEALKKAQEEFAGVAEELGVKDEQDVVDMVKAIRAERSGK